MNKRALSIALVGGISVMSSVFYACHGSNTLSKVDKKLFTVGDCVMTPYRSEFVDSFRADEMVAIEAGMFFVLHNNGVTRAGQHTSICLPASSIEEECVNKAMIDLDLMERTPAKFAQWPDQTPVISSKSGNTFTEVRIAKGALFNYLQYSYGIQREKNDANILLDVSLPSTKYATGPLPYKTGPLLKAIIENCKGHEVSHQ